MSLRANGDVQADTPTKFIVDATGNVEVNTSADAIVNASGNMTNYHWVVIPRLIAGRLHHRISG